MIQLQNIHFGYSKKFPLFKELNMELSSGHIYGLFGKNGAGKTTLLKIMSGLCFPNEGKPLIDGVRAEWRYPEILSKICFIPEDIYTPSLPIHRYAKSYAGFYEKFSAEQFAAYLKEFDIENQNHPLDKLSHGQKKKVIIALALATNSEILLMDEPTNGLDIPSKSIFRRVLASAVTEEKLIIISTHQVRDLHSLIDTVIILDNGKILFNEPNERITEKLSFQYLEDGSESDLVIYSEDSLKGTVAVMENLNRTESKLDIELLFNAIISNSKRINDIFQS